MIARARLSTRDTQANGARTSAHRLCDRAISRVRTAAPPIDMTPAPQTVTASRRKQNTYVVPTARRRDDLVWETRQRLRNADVDAGGVSAGTPRKRMVPNKFVPVTEKRRDDLRWAVRTEMAWIR